MKAALVISAALCTEVFASRSHMSVGVPPRQINLYTFGAPKMTSNSKKWPRKGCFDGLRAEAENYVAGKDNPKDIVTWLLSTYRHPEMKTLRLFDIPSRSEEKPCGWNRAQDPSAKEVDPKVNLHYTSVYEERSSAYGGPIKTMAEVGLHISYNITPDTSYIKSKGWDLIATAIVGREEVSHLLQHPSSLECILTFEGTDRTSEWFKNIDASWYTFCAQGFIHQGFRDVILSMAKSSDFQVLIRPNLGYCSKINVVGHSLGGAMATLWTGCVQGPPNSRSDYKNLKITWKEKQKIRPWVIVPR